MSSELKDLSKKFLIPTTLVLKNVALFLIGFGHGFLAVQLNPRLSPDEVMNALNIIEPFLRSVNRLVDRMIIL